MSKFLQTTLLITVIGAISSISQAQTATVAMAGQYSEANGIIINIPQNPPNAPCTQTGDARCVLKRQQFFGGGGPSIFSGPSVGNRAARNIPNGSLSAGGSFTVPPLAFTQMLGLQVGQVLNNVTVQLDTAFTAAMPPTARTRNPPPETRSFALRTFSPTNVAAHGQNNGLTTGAPGYIYRQGVNTTVTQQTGLETFTMSYSGGLGFTGTMAVLLDGEGRLYLAGPNINGLFPTSLHPIVGTNPVGDTVPGLVTRNAAGWDYTVTGSQMAGAFKAFPSAPTIVGTPCLPTAPPSPVGCNLIRTASGAKWDDVGFFVAPLPGATSTKHMFAWTTGTVSIVRTAVRNGIQLTDTLTGMGYDTVTTGGQRNLGLVAGSYSIRTDGVPQTEMNPQLVGASLKFTPEPGATVALLSGLGLLGAIGWRKRRTA